MQTDSLIDDYIAGVPAAWQRDILSRLRQIIHDEVPDVVECIKWGSAAFDISGVKTGGQLAWMFTAASWVHLSFPMGALLNVPPGTWEEPAETKNKGKRTIKIFEGTFPDEKLLRTLIRSAAENCRTGRRISFAKVPKPNEETDLPDEIEAVLTVAALLDTYNRRPAYQRRGYIQWIDQTKTEASRTKRIAIMLEELKKGCYMPPKKKDTVTPPK